MVRNCLSAAQMPERRRVERRLGERRQVELGRAEGNWRRRRDRRTGVMENSTAANRRLGDRRQS